MPHRQLRARMGLVTNASASWLSWQGYLLRPFGLGRKTGCCAFANLGVLLPLVLGFVVTRLFEASHIRTQGVSRRAPTRSSSTCRTSSPITTANGHPSLRRGDRADRPVGRPQSGREPPSRDPPLRHIPPQPGDLAPRQRHRARLQRACAIQPDRRHVITPTTATFHSRAYRPGANYAKDAR
jgi:hypothetical protein